MSQYVTDTHALYWYLTNDVKLSPLARQVFQEADAGLHQVLVPSIVLIELVYLVERGRLDPVRVDHRSDRKDGEGEAEYKEGHG